MKVTGLTSIEEFRDFSCPLLMHMGFTMSDKINMLSKLFTEGEFFVGTIDKPDGFYYDSHFQDGSIVFVEKGGSIEDENVYIDMDLNVVQYATNPYKKPAYYTDAGKKLFDQSDCKDNAWGVIRFVFNTIVDKTVDPKFARNKCVTSEKPGS